MNKKTRRDFMKAAALAAAAPLAMTGKVSAQEAPQDPLAAAAQFMTDIVQARHGRHLAEGQLKDIQQDLVRMLAQGEVLKRTRLENNDEPAFVFVAEV